MSKGAWRRSKFGFTEAEQAQIPIEYLGCDGELDPSRISPTGENLLFKPNSYGHAWSGLPEGVPAAAVNPSRAIKEMEAAGVTLWRLAGEDGTLIARYRDKPSIVAARKKTKLKRRRKQSKK
jgi:hypothetical protein